MTGNLGPVLELDRYPALRPGAGLRPPRDGLFLAPHSLGQARTGSLNRTPSASDKTIRSPRPRKPHLQLRASRNTTANTPPRPTPFFSDDRSSRRSCGTLPYRSVASLGPRFGRTALCRSRNGPLLPFLFHGLAGLRLPPAEPHPDNRPSGFRPSKTLPLRGAP